MIAILPVTGLPEIGEGTDLPHLLADHLEVQGPALQPGDVVVVTQKIVSKAEGRFVDLATVIPTAEALAIAVEVNKDARLVELVLRESQAVVRKARNVLITRHRLGHVMANAGIDASNIGAQREDWVLLLPDDPDASAARISVALADRFGFAPPVVINDSFGRPWRMGTVNVAIGLCGMPAVLDQRGDIDRDGRVLQVTQPALGDAVAAAAGLAMGEAAEGVPVAIVRGLDLSGPAQTAATIVRPLGEDLFR
jgi:coenzyme F420-0:L-glutamate ligase/coenzyme F420-1:gamma-L-glutamate ligase